MRIVLEFKGFRLGFVLLFLVVVLLLCIFLRSLLRCRLRHYQLLIIYFGHSFILNHTYRLLYHLKVFLHYLPLQRVLTNWLHLLFSVFFHLIHPAVSLLLHPAFFQVHFTFPILLFYHFTLRRIFGSGHPSLFSYRLLNQLLVILLLEFFWFYQTLHFLK